jgi:putative ABC transport system permease protein
MFKNFLRVAIRNLLRSKGFTAINILGLTLGMTSCLLIELYVVDELGYDRYNEQAAHIYRADCAVKYGNNLDAYAAMPGAFGPEVAASFPEVRATVRLRQAYEHPTGFRVRKGDIDLEESSIVYADSGLFRVFTLPLESGNPATALRDPGTAVISEEAATRFFGRRDVLGQTLVLDDTLHFRITGVMKEMPRQSHFRFAVFLSMASLPEAASAGWGGGGYNTYLLLAAGTRVHPLEKTFSELFMKKNGDWMGPNDYGKITLMPVTDIHLRSNLQQELGSNSNIQYVYIFSAIALVILVVAAVNFMNLSTARSAGRAKEVGVRKVLGSSQRSLVLQFLTESIVVTMLSMVLAIGLAILLLPLLSQVSGKELSAGGSVVSRLLLAGLALAAIIGLGAGAYPAFFLSSFQPVRVLKGKLAVGLKGGLRRALVTVQFVVAVFLISGTLVIQKQLHYIETRDLGYRREQIMIVRNTEGLQTRARTFKQKVLSLAGVSSASFTSFVPMTRALSFAGFAPDPGATNSQPMLTAFWPVDADYIKTLGMQVVAGRDFSPSMPSDSSAVIINETAARFLGFKSSVNRTIYQPYPNMTAWQIIGVVKDFNFKSLRENITPAVFYLHPDYGALNVKVRTADIPSLMGEIRDSWNALAPGQPFDYSFMEADFDAAYRSETRMGTIVTIFTVLAIAIASLGLFGLSAYAASQRMREMGIRKVLGANLLSLVGLLGGDFLKLVGLAFLIAAPLSFFIMERWLEDFAFHTTIGWWLIPAAGLAAVGISVVTISFWSVKAALANPIDSLKEIG